MEKITFQSLVKQSAPRMTGFVLSFDPQNSLAWLALTDVTISVEDPPRTGRAS